MVLELLDKMGNQLLMAERNNHRDKFQKWIFSPVGFIMSLIISFRMAD